MHESLEKLVNRSGEIWADLKKDAQGLVPVITVSAFDREVLMQAYMDEEALKCTLETGLMHYRSRSRGRLWLKGETSGHWQKVISCQADCDADCLLFTVEEAGPACHTGARSCFDRNLEELLRRYKEAPQ